MLSTKQAAQCLGIEPSTLRAWRCAKKGPRFYTISSRKVLYDERDLEAFKSERLCVPSVRHTEDRHVALQATQ